MNTIPEPQIRTYQWTLIIIAAVLFGAWELLGHRWLMSLPMGTYHLVSALGAVLWLALATSFVFSMMTRYEKTLRALNAELETKNEALRKLEATRDRKLVELAQELHFALAELKAQAQFSLQSTTELPNIKTFSAAIDRAGEISQIAGELLELKRMSDDKGELDAPAKTR